MRISVYEFLEIWQKETLKLLDDDKIDIGLIGKPASLKTFNFYYLDNIEDIFVIP